MGVLLAGAGSALLVWQKGTELTFAFVGDGAGASHDRQTGGREAPALSAALTGVYSYWSACSTFRRRRPARREDRGEHPEDDRREREDDQLADGQREDDEVDAGHEQRAEHDPSAIPSAPPISAVITLSCRIIRRTCRRVIPIARSIPSSRVRSKTVEHERVHDPEEAHDTRARAARRGCSASS